MDICCRLVLGVYPFTRKGELFICFPKTYKLRYLLEYIFSFGKSSPRGIEWLNAHKRLDTK